MTSKTKSTHRIRPPRWASKLLEWYCKPSLYEDLQGDLLEYFERNVEKKGMLRAKLIYIVDVLKFFRTYTVQKPQIFKGMNQFILLSNYFKTSVRSMARSKLFTTINVVGLAISMSVGLLLIALLYDIQKIDDFHTNKDRIYRVISKRQVSNGGVSNFATASVLAAERVRQEVPGVEKVVVLNGGLTGDLSLDERAISVAGFFASEEFFDIFSFDLKRGNPGAVLAAPNTVVLTESTAKKLFGDADAVGKTIFFENAGRGNAVADKSEYLVTGIVQDVPQNSHLRFNLLVSYATLEKPGSDASKQDWLKEMMSDNVYVLLDQNNSREVLDRNLERISSEENAAFKNAGTTVTASAQAFNDIVPGPHLINWRGPKLEANTVNILIALVVVIMVSACFNYTNLSIARSLTRAKEVGIRKVVGAGKAHIAGQFIVEAIVISLLSLCLAILLFFPIRNEFLQLNEFASGMVSLSPSPALFLLFGVFAIAIGILAGVVPAVSFSKIKSLHVSGRLSNRPMKGLGLRRTLIVLQYAFSLAFITVATLAYKQFHYSVNFDLAYDTKNVLNIDLQKNNPDVVIEQLRQLNEVEAVAQSFSVMSTGYYWYTQVRYLGDSAYFNFNSIDENYIPLLDHKLLAGSNFHHMAGDVKSAGVIVNEKFIERLGIGSPEEAIGKVVYFNGVKESVLGVVEDFHYGMLDSPVEPFVFRYTPQNYKVVHVKLRDGALLAAMDEISRTWDELDPSHPLKAEFYDQHIEAAYQEYLTMVKVVGFLAIISLSIASLGLLGMVVFTTESRMKEISIRKVLGATEGSLLYLLSRGFVTLLLIAGLLAVPVTTWVFEKKVLSNVIYKAPVGPLELLSGVAFVLVLALIAIGTQTIKAARTNPSQILRNE
ncbi:ABC transporter permease [Imperialibacter roseus]|uniref:ABC transporter permease n=1 Tax=Imperialibacter roseus TaxID=1324217 RepID=A0ABZ0ISS7_9BACT|nr:ABC transporter permease [Imperialibacter roseus]WOK07557.1 ABC transporter permease [Imperialibacter roseus]